MKAVSQRKRTQAGKISLRTKLALAAAVGMLPLGVQQVSAADYWWDTDPADGFQAGSGTWGVDDFWTQDGTNLVAWPGGNSHMAILDGDDGDYTLTLTPGITLNHLNVQTSGYTLTGGADDFLTLRYSTSTGGGAYTPNRSQIFIAQDKIFNIGTGSDATTVLANGSNSSYSSQIHIESGGVLNINAGAALMRDNGTGNGGIRFTGGGTVNLYGTVTNSVGNDGIRIGEYDVNSVTFNVRDGGLLSAGSAGGNNSGAPITVAGGSASGSSGTVTLNIESGGTVHVENATATHGFSLARQSGAVGVANISGTLITPKIVVGNGGSGATGTLNLDGGTLRATRDEANFIHAMNSASLSVNVQGGGVTIDTNGFDIGTNQALLNGGGNGGLTKIGEGALTLNGINTYTGATTITEGTLILGGSIANSGLVLGDGTHLETAGNQVNLSSLTFQGAATVDLTTSAALTTVFNLGSGALTTGNIADSISLSIFNSDATWDSGIYSVIDYGSISGLGVDAFADPLLSGAVLSARQSVSFIDTGSAIALQVAGSDPVWRGNLSGNWDYSTQNWVITSGPPTFIAGDNVVFDNSSSNQTITIDAGGVAPVRVDINSGNYVFNGGSIMDDTGSALPATVYVHNGAGLTLNNANAHSGGTIVTDATLNIGHADALGSGPLTIGGTGSTIIDNTSGGTLILGGAPQVWESDFTFAGSNDLDTGSGTVTLSGTRTITTNGTLTVSGDISGSGSLNVTGAGNLVLAGHNTYSGSTSIRDGGELEIAGGVTGTSSSNVHVSPSAGDNAILRVTGGTLNANTIHLAQGSGNEEAAASLGTLEQTGGVVNVHGYVVLGGGSTYDAETLPTGMLNLSGGEFRLHNNRIEVGRGAGGQGVINISDTAALKLLNNSQITLGFGASSDGFTGSFDGTINQTGGSVTFYADAGSAVGGNGALILGFETNPGMAGVYEDPKFTYNLDGGTLTVPQIQRNSTNSSQSIFNFNGGTLVAGRDNATWMQGLTQANVQPGGAIIDSNGFNVTIAQPLLAAGGGLTKQGEGILTLSGNSTYTGATTVTGGTLAITGSLASSGIVIDGVGARFVQNGTNALPGITVTQGTLDGTGTVGNVTVGAGTGGIVANGDGGTGTLTTGNLTFLGAGVLSLNPFGPGTGTAAPLDVNGVFATQGGVGSITVMLPAQSMISGETYNLVSYNSFSGSLADFTLASARAQAESTFLFNGNTLAINYVGGAVAWTGGVSDEWSTATLAEPKNWELSTSPGSTTDYITGDVIVFDDRATSTSVDISKGNVSPLSVTFNNNSQNYTITGTAGLSGDGALVLNGSGEVTIASNNSTRTGSIIVNSGSLTLAGDNSAASAAAVNGATLNLDFAASSAPTSNILNSDGSLALNGGTLNVIGGEGSLNSQSVASTSVSGLVDVNVSNASGGSTVLDMGAVSRSSNGAVVFRLPEGAQSETNGVRTSNTANNGLLGPWAIVQSNGTAAANAPGGYTFAGITDGNVVPYTGATAMSTIQGQSVNANTNYDVTLDSGTSGTNGTPSVNTLRFLNNGTVTYTNTGNGRLTANAIMAAGNGTVNLNGNGTRAGSTNELLLIAASAPINVGGPLIDNGNAAGSMTIMGSNAVTFSNANNSYTGSTNIIGGNLVLSGAGSINSSSGVNIDGGGSLLLAGSSGVTPPINLTSGSITGSGAVSSIIVGDSVANRIANSATGSTLSVDSLVFSGKASLDLALNANLGGAPVTTNSLTTLGGTGSIMVDVDAQGALAFNTNYDLITFDSLGGTGGSAFTVGQISGMSARTDASLITTGSSIALAIGEGTTIYWTGLDDQSWEAGLNGAQKNWKQTSDNVPTDFLVNDQVVFNDLGDTASSGSVVVDISGDPIVAGNVAFENTPAVSYTLNGNGIASGAITKTGSGTVTINAANTHTGGTTFTGGRLNIGNAAALGTGPLVIEAGSAKTLDNVVDPGEEGGTLVLGVSSHIWNDDFTFAGTQDLNTGTGAVTLGGSRTITVDAGTLTVGGQVSGGSAMLTKAGEGELVLRGRSNHTGGTVVNGGVLGLGVGGGTGTVVGGITINDGGTVRTMAGDALGYNEGVHVSEVVVNSGGTFEIGTGGNQGYRTKFILNGGTVQTAGGGSIHFDVEASGSNAGIATTAGGVESTFSAPVTIRGSTLPVDVVADSTLNVTGNIGGGSGGLIKTGGGTLRLAGNNNHNGGTFVNDGTLVIGHANALAGRGLAVSNGALAQVEAGLDQAVLLNSLALNGTGAVDLTDGMLTINHGGDSAVPDQVLSWLSDSYDTGFSSGALHSSLANASQGLGWTDDGSATTVAFAYFGDINMDGVVDGLDLNILGSNWQSTNGVWSLGDLNYDGVVDGLDLNLLGSNWQAGVGQPLDLTFAQAVAAMSLPVPEPASLSLLAFAGLALGRRRRCV